jgi:hypothetical protein
MKKRIAFTMSLLLSLLLLTSTALAGEYGTEANDNGEYFGWLTDGEFNGYGMMRYAIDDMYNDSMYFGMYTNSVQNGFGVWIYTDDALVENTKYTRHSSGMFNNGDLYSGAVMDVAKNGDVIRTEGEWKNGKAVEGSSTKTINEYDWKDFVITNSVFYIGEVKYETEIPHGYGAMYNAYEKVYHVGQFVDGKPEGYGIQIKDGESYFEGEWSGGSLVEVINFEGVVEADIKAFEWSFENPVVEGHPYDNGYAAGYADGEKDKTDDTLYASFAPTSEENNPYIIGSDEYNKFRDGYSQGYGIAYTGMDDDSAEGQNDSAASNVGSPYEMGYTTGYADGVKEIADGVEYGEYFKSSTKASELYTRDTDNHNEYKEGYGEGFKKAYDEQGADTTAEVVEPPAPTDSGDDEAEYDKGYEAGYAEGHTIYADDFYVEMLELEAATGEITQNYYEGYKMGHEDGYNAATDEYVEGYAAGQASVPEYDLAVAGELFNTLTAQYESGDITEGYYIGYKVGYKEAIALASATPAPTAEPTAATTPTGGDSGEYNKTYEQGYTEGRNAGEDDPTDEDLEYYEALLTQGLAAGFFTEEYVKGFREGLTAALNPSAASSIAPFTPKYGGTATPAPADSSSEYDDGYEAGHASVVDNNEATASAMLGVVISQYINDEISYDYINGYEKGYLDASDLVYGNNIVTINYDNGNVYVGEALNGLKHGTGKFTWASGHVYVGEYVNDKRTGQGTYTWPTGEFYEGSFENNARHGQGKQYDKDGNLVQQGIWENGDYVGTAEAVAALSKIPEDKRNYGDGYDDGLRARSTSSSDNATALADVDLLLGQGMLTEDYARGFRTGMAQPLGGNSSASASSGGGSASTGGSSSSNSSYSNSLYSNSSLYDSSWSSSSYSSSYDPWAAAEQNIASFRDTLGLGSSIDTSYDPHFDLSPSYGSSYGSWGGFMPGY